MKKKQWLTKLGVLGIAVVALAGCSSADANENDSASASSANPDAETVVVGTGNGYQPFVYLDENNELQGYDVEVLKAVDEKLDQYNFQYESMDFKNILTSLSAKKVRLAAHQYEYNDERGAKYLYGEVGYTDYTLYIVTAEGQPIYTSLDDLQGKKVSASQGSNVAYLLEKYNKEHTDPKQQIEIVYGDGTGEIFVTGLKNGTFDAGILTKYDKDKYNEQFSANIQISTEPINVSQTYFIYNKGDDTLKDAVDGALQELKDDGTLSKISTESLGNDYTK